jgi:acyl-homoserine-lactone acylase
VERLIGRAPARGLVRLYLVGGLAPLLAGCPAGGTTGFPERVEIRRTSFGVPHILADDLAALGYGLAWCHMEDYGPLVVERLTMARGELALHLGSAHIESDFWWRQRYEQAARAYPSLHRDARDLYEGYAAAVNRYIDLHSTELPAWATPEFTGVDVATHWADETLDGAKRRFRSFRVGKTTRRSAASSGDGSNAWAFGPSRSASGRAILVRNPHLTWGAGRYSAYYEAHLTVPGVIDFYGDFRVGYPMYFNGGFNRHLGWSTTNNSPDLEEFYALAVDTETAERYLLDGESRPLDRQTIEIRVRAEGTIESATRDFFHTELGPVIERSSDTLFVVRSADWGEYRRTEQFLRMMQATSLGEWMRAMRMRAMKESNFIYADDAGNIYYVWNAALPLLPHDSGRDTVAIPVRFRDDAWSELVPFDSLPQLLNPRGGYLHNENDSFHYTSLEDPLETPSVNAAWPEPQLRLRSQLSLQLVRGAEGVTLEDVIQLKHSPRMLRADRVKDDLIGAVRSDTHSADVRGAIDLVEAWPNTSATDSRGGSLFELWVDRYDALGGDYAHPWDPESPASTPAGLGDPVAAVRAFREAVEEAVEIYGSWDITWGASHRVRWGDVDVPVSGCHSRLGCFRHLGFERDEDGILRAYTGDAWILAVEFGDVPRAYSVLVFGQSADPSSPHHDDQAPLFARQELKRVAFTEEEIEADLVRRYRPG